MSDAGRHVAGASRGTAVDGLTYPSDSDEPFHAISWPPGAGRCRGAGVTPRRRPGRDGDGGAEWFADLADDDQAERFKSLRDDARARGVGADRGAQRRGAGVWGLPDRVDAGRALGGGADEERGDVRRAAAAHSLGSFR